MTLVNRYVALAYLLPATLFAATSNEITEAVRDLGAPDSKSLEAATKFHTIAGKEAVQAVQAAAQSADPEVRIRARALLPTIRFGFPLGTSPEVCRALDDYPKATVTGKIATVKLLLALGSPARPVVIELAQLDPDTERFAIFQELLLPFGDAVGRQFATKKLTAESVAQIQEIMFFCVAILPQEWGDFAPHVIQRFDAAGQTNAANSLFERTYQQLNQLCLADSPNSWRHTGLARLCFKSHRQLDDALKHCEKAIAFDGLNDPTVEAEFYFQKGDKDRALALINKAIEVAPREDYQQQRDRIKRGDPSVPWN